MSKIIREKEGKGLPVRMIENLVTRLKSASDGKAVKERPVTVPFSPEEKTILI
jgi:hypothetical protein